MLLCNDLRKFGEPVYRIMDTRKGQIFALFSFRKIFLPALADFPILRHALMALLSQIQAVE